ncbi:HNH endonuclease family protein [Prauserella oleivorans]|uniref:HNH endonuclease family protein n=1 Tax=Prauserella oleivorans TaxID=1478153 RepID=A0ABW5W9D9_9PSEU
MASKRARGSTVVSLIVLAVAAVIWWFTDDPTSADSAAPAPVTASEALTTFDSLTVAPEDTGYPYDRDDWPHWSSHGDGCNTREIALQRQGSDVVTDEKCRAVSGSWRSSYDGVVMADAGDADLDHLVPLAEAARSGVRGWTEEQREAFANDLDQLVVVTARSNRQKGDQDPASWLPDEDRCGYAARWVAVKAKYSLTVDQDERDALRAVLSHCPA